MKFIKIKSPRKSLDLTKRFYPEAWDLMNVENYKIQRACALTGFLLVAKVCRLRIRKHLVSLAK